MLVRLIYASRATGEIDEPLLRSILECSRAQNPKHGVTGILCAYAEGGVYLQALEGSREAVNRLYANLLEDERHEEVTLFSFEEIEERRFAAWQMGIVDLGKINRSTILRFSGSAELDPYALSSSQALALLAELAETASVASRELTRRGASE